MWSSEPTCSEKNPAVSWDCITRYKTLLSHIRTGCPSFFHHEWGKWKYLEKIISVQWILPQNAHSPISTSFASLPTIKETEVTGSDRNICTVSLVKHLKLSDVKTPCRLYQGQLYSNLVHCGGWNFAVLQVSNKVFQHSLSLAEQGEKIKWKSSWVK